MSARVTATVVCCILMQILCVVSQKASCEIDAVSDNSETTTDSTDSIQNQSFRSMGINHGGTEGTSLDNLTDFSEQWKKMPLRIHRHTLWRDQWNATTVCPTQWHFFHLRCDGIFSDGIIENFLLILTVKQFRKSVNIWSSYGIQKIVPNFWATLYTPEMKLA